MDCCFETPGFLKRELMRPLLTSVGARGSWEPARRSSASQCVQAPADGGHFCEFEKEVLLREQMHGNV